MSRLMEVMNSTIFEEELDKLELKFFGFAALGSLSKTQVQEMRACAKAAESATQVVHNHPEFANRVALLDRGFKTLVSRYRTVS